jgi:hypothetical protein
MKFVSTFNAVHLNEDPLIASDGELYFNSASNVFRYHTSGSWVSIIDAHTLREEVIDTIFNVGTEESASFTYTLNSSNVNGSVIGYSASLSKFILPSDDDDLMPTGSIIRIIHGGDGDIEIDPHVDVTLHAASPIYLKSKWQTAKLIKTSVNTWILTGEFPDLY